MATYDYRCAKGHVTEAVRPMRVSLIDCECGEPAQRESVYRNQYVGGDGITAHCPTREAQVNLTRFEEAHGEILHDAEKAGVEPLDLLKVAKDRVRRGDAVAIE